MIDDRQLIRLVELAFPEMSDFDREVYAHARLRVLMGKPLTPVQRLRLRRLLPVVERLRAQLHRMPRDLEETPHAPTA